MAKAPPIPEVTIIGGTPVTGKDVNLHDGALVDCQGTVTIGDGTFCGHRVMILTGSHNMFEFGPPRRLAAPPRPVTIGKYVWICSGAIICPGVTIGDYAVVGPGAVVMRNVAPYTVVAGNPARVVRRLRSKDYGTTHEAAGGPV